MSITTYRIDYKSAPNHHWRKLDTFKCSELATLAGHMLRRYGAQSTAVRWDRRAAYYTNKATGEAYRAVF